MVADRSRAAGGRCTAGSTDFEDRLRKLDALRRDGLITDSEYQAKRSEIVAERW